jgi:hypothetical protein
MDHSAISDEKTDKAGKVPQPKDMVVYDPDHRPFQRRHVCVLLRKVADSLHGHPEEESTEEL